MLWTSGAQKILIPQQTLQQSKEMKKKLILSIFWFLAAVLWIGIYKFAIYKVDMYYSILSAQQLENDNTYGKLQFHNTATTITGIVFFVGVVFIVYKIIMILSSKSKTSAK